MELSINLDFFAKIYGMETAAKAFGEAGFKTFDYTPKMYGDWKKEIRETQKIFEKSGLSTYQCHAPYNRYTADTISVEMHKKGVLESLDAAEILGAKYLVIHGDEFDYKNLEYSPQKALEYNYEYFAQVVEAAEKKNIKIAFENVFQDIFDTYRNCRTIEELIALIDKFKTDNVCCCWDFGHAAVAYKEKQDEAIKNMNGRIECTHIHDNYLDTDSHLIPCLGMIDWKACISAIKKENKVDVFSFELGYGRIPVSALSKAAEYMYKTGEYLLSL